MIARLAIRTLLSHPVRTAVLAAGFGTGVSVMAILLGVAEIVLDQARSPLLAGGGDVVVSGPIAAPQLLISSTLQSPPLAGRTLAVAPWSRSTLYLVHGGDTVPVKVRGGIPSEERALGDPEVVGAQEWSDTPADVPWKATDPEDILRSLDRFHPIPDVPDRAASWAEWLYFNGRTTSTRFYLTFLVGPGAANGMRSAGVRLQLERDGRMESFSASAELSDEAIAQAPELTIGANHIDLDGPRYRIALDLRGPNGARATGHLIVESQRGRQLPPIEIRGARGWMTGYVVPVMSGALSGWLTVGGERIDVSGGSAYHDHNWGFWEGVSWQWGQVQHDDISIVFGRVFPPRDAADAERIPGFLAVIGPHGPLGYSTRVTIDERNAPQANRLERITVKGRSGSVDLTMDFDVGNVTTSRLPGPMGTSTALGSRTTLDFLQMRGRYAVSGTAGERRFTFEAPGSAETFRGR